MQTEGDTVLVAGATGGVGQLVTAKLLEVRDSPAMQPPRQLPGFVGHLPQAWHACATAAGVQGQGARQECAEGSGAAWKAAQPGGIFWQAVVSSTSCYVS